MQRQHVRYDSDRSIELLVAESALRYPERYSKGYLTAQERIS
jgi:hypothetical protein